MNKAIHFLIASSLPLFLNAQEQSIVQKEVKIEDPVVQVEAQQDEQLSFAVKVGAEKTRKKNILLALVGPMDPEFSQLTDIIKKDLEFSGTLSVDVRSFGMLSSKADVTALAKEGYELAIFFNATNKKHEVEWRIYDTDQSTMIKGSKYSYKGDAKRGWAHNISDIVWQVVTGNQGFFSTKIAYCKDVPSAKKRKIKYVYIADYDGSNEQLLVANPTVNVAPRWNNDSSNPLLFYSEYTNSNVRLIAVNMEKKRKIASNFDGVNMLASFSGDGKQVIYCASQGKGNCQLHYYEKGQLKKLTDNKGNNISPTFSADGKRVFFCSDFQTGQPQIYCLDVEKNEMKRLTTGGYCASPSYCNTQNAVVYSKIEKGVMQLFLYDVDKATHTQLTFDAGHKEECSWSPGGDFILFSYEHKNKSRIAMMNMHTKERKYVTSEKTVCSYPTWSPAYDQFPVVA
jgi:TolB protein